MEPELKVGEFIVIHEQDTYQKGDIITYDYHTGISVTHRIVDIDGDYIHPQGDQNAIPDPKISINDVYGKVVFHFPIMYIFGGFAVIILCLLVDAFLHPDE
jgi:signal peptidase